MPVFISLHGVGITFTFIDVIFVIVVIVVVVIPLNFTHRSCDIQVSTAYNALIEREGVHWMILAIS